MTPPFEAHYPLGLALGLERLTGRRIVHRYRYYNNYNEREYWGAEKDIAEGRVAVSKRWLAELIRKAPIGILGTFKLDAEKVKEKDGKKLYWPEREDASAQYWAEQIETGLFVPPGVLLKEDKNEG